MTYAAARKKPWNASEYGSTTNAPPNIERVAPSTTSVITGISAASTPNVAIARDDRPRYSKKKSAISTTTIVAERMISGAIAWKSTRVHPSLSALVRRFTSGSRAGRSP